MKAVTFHCCGEVDCGRTEIRDRFVSYNFETVESIGLDAETVSVNERVRSSEEGPMVFTLPAVLVYFHSGVSRIFFEAVRWDFGKYRSLAGNPDEAEVPDATGGVYLDALVEEDLLWIQAGDADDVIEEALDAMRSLVEAVGHVVPILKTRYLVLVCALSDKVQRAHSELEATTR